MFQKILPPAWLLAAIFLMILLHLVLPILYIIPAPWNLFGLIPLLLGIAVNILADKLFHRYHTAVRPFDEPSHLITSGVYRISRNPMYLGFMLILVGVAVLLRSLGPYLAILAFGILIQSKYISPEEQNLAQKFGSEWVEYSQQTRRWL